MQLGNLSATFMAACTLNGTPHRDDDITPFIHLNVLDLDIWNIKRYLDFGHFYSLLCRLNDYNRLFYLYLSTTQDTREPYYYDISTSNYVALKRLNYAGKMRTMAVTYNKGESIIDIITIHPIKEGQKEKRIRNGRWVRV